MKIIITGKSGSGKDIISRILINTYRFKPIISYTTRPMRVGEQEGVEYHFVPESDFEEMQDIGFFIESRSYNTTYEGEAKTWNYATAYPDFNQRGNLVMIKDLEGTKHLKKLDDKIIVIFIGTDDLVRESRAKQRGSFCQVEWSRRLTEDDKDFKQEDVIKSCDYFLTNNGGLGELKRDLASLLELILQERG